MNFKKNKVYNTEFIKSYFGGNIQCSMPIIGGKVPYCKFDPKINNALILSNEVWVEVGPIRAKASELLVSQNMAVPIFYKLGVNKWKYVGDAEATDISSLKQISSINKNPPRDKVQKILKLKFN